MVIIYHYDYDQNNVVWSKIRLEKNTDWKSRILNAQYNFEKTAAIISWKVSDTLNKYENLTQQDIFPSC